MSLGTFTMQMMANGGKKVYDALEENTKKPREVQEELLRRILDAAKDSVYGKEHHFGDIHSIADFQKNVPLNDYDSLSPYIERMANGEEHILTDRKIPHFNETSGTVGQPKKVPLSEEQINLFRRYNANYFNYLAKKYFGREILNGKCFSVMEGRYTTLPSGATYGSASAVATARMNRGPFHDMLSGVYTTPIEGRQPLKGTTPRYLHARFALAEPNVTYGNCTFSSYFLEMMRYIEKNWEMLVHDIETGTVDPSVTIPEKSMQYLRRLMKPNPKRAQELRRIFSAGFETPFVPKVWPHFTAMYMAGGAGFLPYTEKLKERYFGDSVHYFFLGLSASEGLFSIPMKPDDFHAVFIPDGNFLEFIPVGEEEEAVKTLDELEVGKRYEVVVTNLCGLYRYRMNDCVEITGFHNATPTMIFKYRLNSTVSLIGEKTTEIALSTAIANMSRELNMPVYDYTVFPDPDRDPLRYVWLLELDSYPCPHEKEKIAAVLDKFLGEANPSVAAKLESGVFQPSEIHFLQPETYMLYRDFMIARGKSVDQLKPVHIIRNEMQRKFFFALQEE